MFDERFADLSPDLLAGTSVRRLQSAAIRALTPRPEPIVDLFHVNPIRLTVAEAVGELADELPRLGRTTFRRLTAGQSERLEVIVRFLAVLELYKQGFVEIDQPDRFGEIEITWAPTDDCSPDSILVDTYEG
jgi:segregation and condensation protein A